MERKRKEEKSHIQSITFSDNRKEWHCFLHCSKPNTFVIYSSSKSNNCAIGLTEPPQAFLNAKLIEEKLDIQADLKSHSAVFYCEIHRPKFKYIEGTKFELHLYFKDNPVKQVQLKIDPEWNVLNEKGSFFDARNLKNLMQSVFDDIIIPSPSSSNNNNENKNKNKKKILENYDENKGVGVFTVFSDSEIQGLNPEYFGIPFERRDLVQVENRMGTSFF